MGKRNKKDRKPFNETGFGKFLAKDWIQRGIEGSVGEIPFVGNALAGILKPTKEGKFNFQPNWKRLGITTGFSILIAVMIQQGWITKEGIQDAIDIVFSTIK